MKINVYVDGFNLFYGSLKAKPNPNLSSDMQKKLKQEKKKLRWLDLNKLVMEFVKGKNIYIQKINFYTADVKPHYTGDKSPLYQQEYFKALKTLKNINIIKGRYDLHPKKLPVYPLQNPLVFQTVLNTEEKRSDVNFAAHLVYDSCIDDFDMAVLITNDSDLLEPIKIAKKMGKRFLILSPHSSINNDFLINFDISSLRKISSKNIKNSQFPDIVYDENQNIVAKRPQAWA
ncbi:MAG: NYN domain-containing protein [Alphaproteobacteria bacterium]|nr:NYN domain-containing protein [Alphaproteobacteria bacterium]